MHLLTLLVELLSLAVIILWVKNNIKKISLRLTFLNREKESLLENIEGRIKFTQDLNAKLKDSLELEYNLFDLTKDLSHCIEESDILKTFSEKICVIFNISECAFLETQQDKNKRFRKENILPIILNGKTKLYLGLKGIEETNRKKMDVLINQLQLSLKRHGLYSEIQKLSITDTLTGMFIRRYFMERFKQELQRSKQNTFELSLLLIDIDNFKHYNDTYGHITGDAILIEVAKIIGYSLRQIDMAARYGGEELCVLLPQTGKEGALFAAERIRAGTSEALIKAYDESIKVTLSIGIASYPNDAENTTDLIDTADKALYKAKAQGKNKVCARE